MPVCLERDLFGRQDTYSPHQPLSAYHK